VKNLASVMTNPEALWYEEVLETLSELRRSQRISLPLRQSFTLSHKNLASVMTNPEALWYEEVLETLSELRRSLGQLPSN
jgi:hypothetical protein